MLTIYEDVQYQVDASLAGASAYVTKHRMHTELIPILTALLDSRPSEQFREPL